MSTWNELKQEKQFFVSDTKDVDISLANSFAEWVSEVTGQKFEVTARQNNSTEIQGEFPEGFLVTFKRIQNW